MTTFTVPGEPITKGRPRFSRHGARVMSRTPARTKQYEHKVRLCALTAGLRPLDGPVAVSVCFYLPTLRQVDVDNLLKSLLDGLNGAAFKDDAQVWEVHASKSLDRANPRAVVTVAALTKGAA